MGAQQGRAQADPHDPVTESDRNQIFHFPAGLERSLRSKFRRDELTRYSILKRDDPDAKELREKIEGKSLSTSESRAIACMVGNAVGDALGAPLEFSAVRYGSTELKEMGQKEVWTKQGYNRFGLKPGQWTDDAAMGLCIADSLLLNSSSGDLNPHDLRLRFLNWWECGYNNAFGYDDDRRWGCSSVGLGGNIGQSMREFVVRRTKFTSAGNRRTSGNGSLMRNGPVPARFWNDEAKGMKAAYEQSKTTHQGDEAAECCRLLTHICCRAIKTEGKVDVKALLNSLPDTFKSEFYSVQCLAAAKQEERCNDNKELDLRDRNWTWKDPKFRFAPGRSKQMPGYIGSYAMDNLSMSLHCIYSTSSAKEAMLYCANMRGDSDSVCAVVGQLAGAIYGLDAIPSSWIEAVERWDGGGSIKLRAFKLYKAGRGASKPTETGSGMAVEAESKDKNEVVMTVEVESKGKNEAGETATSLLAEEDSGGYAPAQHSCEHAEGHIKKISASDAKEASTKMACKTCGEGDIKNLWVCTATNEIYCGRYAKACMIKYANANEHKIAMCLGDLSFWCYGCDSYLHHLSIRPVYDFYNAWHQAKFNEPVKAPFAGS